MVLRLFVDEQTPEETLLYQTTLNQRISSWRTPDYEMRVIPGDPGHSGVLARMRVRSPDQMPPIATERVDQAGIAAVTAWIEGLSQ